MSKLDFVFTLKILLLAVIAYIIITAWGEVISRTLLQIFGFDRESIISWLILALLSTTFLILILNYLEIEAHDILGISEVVDVQLTGQNEIYQGRKTIHIPAS